MGTCQWEGYRGVGLPCTPACEEPDAVVVAQNSNSYGVDEDGLTSDLTCTGGYQAYCCSGFVPSSKTNTANMFLYGQGIFSKRSLPSLPERVRDIILAPRNPSPGEKGAAAGLTFATCAVAIAALIAEAPWTFGITLLGIPAELALCAASGVAVSAMGFASKPSGVTKGPPRGQQPPPNKPKSGGKSAPKVQIGQWPILQYPPAPVPKGQCDCSVTYTCRYGLGWDEVCDNQRWAITMHLNQQNVFHVFGPGLARPNGRAYDDWRNNQRSDWYRTLLQGSRTPRSAACELDEFPMGDLEESARGNPQACRLVNRAANKRQGNDYKFWKQAQWQPCRDFRTAICGMPDPPAYW